MHSFKSYLSEIRIKLGGSSGVSAKIKAFLKDLDTSSQNNPFNNKTHVIGNAEVHVSPDTDGIHIHDIRSFEQGSGAGTKALEHLIKLADKHSLKLNLIAKGYASTSTSQLQKWYKRYGFVSDEDDYSMMVRYPK